MMTSSIVATYPYTDQAGRVLYEAVRFEPKRFMQRVPLGDDRYEYRLSNICRVPYHLADLLQRKSRETVFVVEGEKDADSLRALGFCATTSAQGASWKWTPEFVEYFRGSRRVVVIADCDEGSADKGTRKGREAARERAALLRGVCDDVRLLDLDPARQDGYDVTDWLADGHSARELKALVESAVSLPPLTPDAPPAKPLWDDAAPWPMLHEAALHGIAGRIVRAIEPHTEADAGALLFTLLTCVGNLIGPGPHVRVGPVRHEARLSIVVVGASAKARKGQSLAEVAQFVAQAEPEVFEQTRVSGLASGEGLIARVRDREDGVSVEKRALVHEPEFARLLAAAGREGATLSAIMRDAWDGSPLRVLTRKDPLEAKGAFISFVGHITEEELHVRLASVEVANGFANRILFVCAKRSKLLPTGGSLQFSVVVEMGRQLRAALAAARGLAELPRSVDFGEAWDELYPRFPDEPGIAGVIVARAETQTLRLALVYALLDGSPTLDLEHLVAGYAAWQYAEDSARHIFGRKLGDDVRQKLLDEIRAAYPEGVDRTAQRDLFNRHASETRIGTARDWLLEQDLAEEREEPTEGRPRRVLFAKTRDQRGDKGLTSPLLPLLARLSRKNETHSTGVDL